MPIVVAARDQGARASVFPARPVRHKIDSVLHHDFHHYVKVGDLDSLETFVRDEEERIEVCANFELVFASLDKRTSIDDQVVLQWGERYIRWSATAAGHLLLGTAWATRMLELSEALGRLETAKSAVEAVLFSDAPLERERIWWQKQRYRLDHLGHL